MDMFGMFIISIIAGLLSSMNVWVVDINHVRLHLNDIYMALLMAGWMLFLQTAFYYKHMKNANVTLMVSILLIAVIFYAIRTQSLVNDRQFLNGMIPHHSMAILMAEKIKDRTNNPDLVKLADGIIDTQTKEIKIMDDMLIKG